MYLSADYPLAVFPVLVGPLQTLLAFLPAILVAVGSMLYAAFQPRGFVTLMRFCWRQKLFFGAVAGVIVLWQYGIPVRWVGAQSPHGPGSDTHHSATDWTTARGGTRRLGRGPGSVDPTAPGVNWRNTRDETLLSSPAVSGNRLIVSTATGIGPFSPAGRGAIVCVDALTGREAWRYAPDDFRATFSSPVVLGDSVVCGEGLHQVEDARVTCLDLRTGQRRWEFRTGSHVESTAAIADGRVFIGAGSDGFYCLALEPDPDGQPRVLWHLESREFPDCESSPAVHDGVVYFGLGEGGAAVCAVKAQTGALQWKLDTPYPVFAPPTVAGGRMWVATGNGNYVQSAADLLEMKLQMLRDDGATEHQLADAQRRWKPAGEVWCIGLATRNVEWKFAAGDAILGAIAADDDAIYFGSRDGSLYRVSMTGVLLGRCDLHEPLVSAPAVGRDHVYCTTASGRLFCLQATSMKPLWDCSLGPGVTFASSPTLAHGQVYIGTARQGLLSLGKPGLPDPAIWADGDRGGSADDVPVPNSLGELWTFPVASEPPFSVTTPLMVLDRALYAAGTRSGRSEFLRLNVQGTAPSVAWTRPFTGPIVTAPLGCGDRLFVVEHVERDAVRLHALSATTGDVQWSRPLPGLDPTHPVRMTIDHRWLFAWTASDRLGCFDQRTGEPVWEQTMAETSDAVPSPAHPVGAPAAADQLLFVVTGTGDGAAPGKWPHSTGRARMSAIDAPTGTPLWSVALNESPVSGPRVAGQSVVLPLADDAAVYNIVDGAFVRKTPLPDSPFATSLPADDHRTTPVVTLGGRVYYATDQGRIRCLGAGPP